MTTKNLKKRIPIMLASKVDGVKANQKLDDILRDELYGEEVVSHKNLDYPNLRNMITLSNAYGLLNDIFGKKSAQSKDFRKSCVTGENLFIYYSKKTDLRYVDREKFHKFIEKKVNDY